MSVDIADIVACIWQSKFLWSSPFSIGIGMYLLWQELGISTLAAIGTMFILIIPVNIITGRLSKKYNKQQLKIKDERINLTNECLIGIKLLKLYGWETPFKEAISNH